MFAISRFSYNENHIFLIGSASEFYKHKPSSHIPVTKAQLLNAADGKLWISAAPYHAVNLGPDLQNIVSQIYDDVTTYGTFTTDLQ